MRFDEKKPPRDYQVGINKQITIHDCGSIRLEADEQVTFISGDKEYDVAKKSWGYYATPSVNGRLARFGYKTALVKNSFGQLYVMIVDPEFMNFFEDYLLEESQEVVEWLDERKV